MINKFRVGGIVLVLSMCVIAFHVWMVWYCAPIMIGIYNSHFAAGKEEFEKAIVAALLQKSILIPLIIGTLITLIYPLLVFFKNRNVFDKKYVIVLLAIATYLIAGYLILSILCLLIWLFQQNKSNTPKQADV